MSPPFSPLSSKPPRVRRRTAAPGYPALLALAIAGATASYATAAQAADPADAQADVSDADASTPEAPDDAGISDEMVSGCSATMYCAGHGAVPPGAAAICGLIAAAASYRRRRQPG